VRRVVVARLDEVEKDAASRDTTCFPAAASAVLMRFQPAGFDELAHVGSRAAYNAGDFVGSPKRFLEGKKKIEIAAVEGRSGFRV
jgi:hypothetical protein